MISLPIGIVGFILMVYLAGSGANWSAFLNAHAFWIVIGGSTMILLLGNSLTVIRALFHNLGLLLRRSPTLRELEPELRRLAQDRNAVSTSPNELIRYAISLWEKGVDANTFIALISQYREILENDDVEAVSALQNLSKYPPALGMMGTVMGLIGLFGNLGADNKESLGPSLAVAMTATFYGLFVANGLIMPITDRMHVETIRRKKLYGMVYEILLLINRREPAKMVAEEISYRVGA